MYSTPKPRVPPKQTFRQGGGKGTDMAIETAHSMYHLLKTLAIEMILKFFILGVTTDSFLMKFKMVTIHDPTGSTLTPENRSAKRCKII